MSIALRIAKYPPLPGFGLDLHELAPGSVIPPSPVPLPAAIPMFPWTALMTQYSSALISGKYTIVTLTEYMGDILCGYDWGKMQPHLPIPPTIAATNMPLVMSESSHKYFLPSYPVKEAAHGGLVAALAGGDTPVAVCSPGGFMTAIQDCGKPMALPTGLGFHLPTVRWLGFSFTDLLCGAMSVVADHFVDKTLKGAQRRLPDGLTGAILGAALNQNVATVVSSRAKDNLLPSEIKTPTDAAITAAVVVLMGPFGVEMGFGKVMDLMGDG